MIRNFLYLDSQKLRSISSQLFDGVAQYVLHSEQERKEDFESQKGNFSSGRMLGDIFSKEKSSTEMKFLEDHAYSIFEEKLIEMGLVEDSLLLEFSANSPKAFFKITNNLRINDMVATVKMIDNFNSIGEALVRITNMQSDGIGNSSSMSDADVVKYEKKNNMRMDEKFLKSLSKMISFGLNDVIEVNLTLQDYIFSAPLKRDFLRDSVEMILNMYSRLTQQKFTLFGSVTQRGAFADAESDEVPFNPEDGVKVALRALSQNMRNVEQSFLGPLSSEIVVDPIAVYATI